MQRLLGLQQDMTRLKRAAGLHAQVGLQCTWLPAPCHDWNASDPWTLESELHIPETFATAALTAKSVFTVSALSRPEQHVSTPAREQTAPDKSDSICSAAKAANMEPRNQQPAICAKALKASDALTTPHAIA